MMQEKKGAIAMGTTHQLKSFGELFSLTWGSYKDKLQPVLTISAGLALVTVIATLAGQNFLGFIFSLAAAAASILASICYNYLLDGKTSRPELSELVKTSASKFVPVLLAVLLLVAIVVGGLVLLIVPGIMFMVWFMFAVQAVIFEGKTGMQALTQSREYVRNRWWAMFGRILLAGLVLVLASAAFGILASVFGSGAKVLNDLFSVFVVTPMSAIFSYHLYRSAVESYVKAA